MKTAKYIKRISGWQGNACLYELSHPVKYPKSWNEREPSTHSTNYVIVSSVNVLGRPETFAFPASQDGEALDMLELDFSMMGTLSHKEVLDNGGFEIEDYCPDIFE